MDGVCIVFYESPIGIMEIVGKNRGILSVNFIDEEEYKQSKNRNVTLNKGEGSLEATEHVNRCKEQLDKYFKGRLKEFDIDIVFEGTEFQKKVWKALMEIPYNETKSYGGIAKKIGNKKAARAVGNANNKNPISIIVPCHRVIGGDGSLTGYGGGLWRKKWLLEHETNTVSLYNFYV